MPSQSRVRGSQGFGIGTHRRRRLTRPRWAARARQARAVMTPATAVEAMRARPLPRRAANRRARTIQPRCLTSWPMRAEKIVAPRLRKRSPLTSPSRSQSREDRGFARSQTRMARPGCFPKATESAAPRSRRIVRAVRATLSLTIRDRMQRSAGKPLSLKRLSVARRLGKRGNVPVVGIAIAMMDRSGERKSLSGS